MKATHTVCAQCWRLNGEHELTCPVTLSHWLPLRLANLNHAEREEALTLILSPIRDEVLRNLIHTGHVRGLSGGPR